MPVIDRPSHCPLGDYRGKALEKVETSFHEGVLSVDLILEGGLSLELTFRFGCNATAKAVQWTNGDSEVLHEIPFERLFVEKAK